MKAAQSQFEQAATDDDDEEFGEVFGDEDVHQHEAGEHMQGGEEGRQVFIQIITAAAAAAITEEQAA